MSLSGFLYYNMSVKFARVLTLLVVMVIAGCSSDQVVVDNSTQADRMIARRIQRDAEDMALFYSGEFRPPADLTREISSQMYALHGVGADKGIDAVGPWVWFQPPWLNHVINCKFDSISAPKIASGKDRQWASIVKKYDLTVQQAWWDDQYFTLSSFLVVHPELLAARIEAEKVKGMLWLSPTPRYYPLWSNVARQAEANSVKYFVLECPCPDLWYAYRYFEFHGPWLEDHGYFRECPDDTSAAWHLPWKLFGAVLDSIEASRPAWVDTARTELWNLERPLRYDWRDGSSESAKR
jgi:hypothetical protein